jgi:hypothetical protein
MPKTIDYSKVLYEPILKQRYEIERQKANSNIHQMFNHEITRAVIKVIKENKKRKENENAELV